MARDRGLDTLLALDGEIIMQAGGWWVKIEAWRVEASERVPHGIRYSLTLHDHLGQRVMGYDNAHAANPRRQARYSGRRVKAQYDHKHRHINDKGVAYEFRDAGQLLIDFWSDVDAVLKEHGVI